MSDNSNRSRGTDLIDSFVESLADLKGVDPDVAVLVQGLYGNNMLTSKQLLAALAKQREAWDRAETT